MKTILSTIATVALLAGAAHAKIDAFSDPRQALPRASGFEQALPRTGDDEFRDALPRSSNDDFRQALPLSETFPDVVVALP
jgi:hypothetical protein